MSSAQKQTDEGFFEHADLQFDLRNPRGGDRVFADEEEILTYLIDNADVDELVTSIQNAGWIDFEPMIVQRGDNAVLEGNRRLAALRLLSDQPLRNRLGYKLAPTTSPVKLPEKVRVRWVANRADAREFIAFKHINGPFKWDALAKAKYAADWLNDGGEVGQVSKSIGDTHNTVLRLVNGWRVLHQATDEGFDIDDITARRFNFSHLYTALSRPNVRTFLDLPEEPAVLLADSPIPKASSEKLAELMGWLFGQAKQARQHVIKSQNPDLNRLVRILGSAPARAALASTKDLTVAFEIVEPASNRFEEALIGASTGAERALGLVSHFDPKTQPTLLDTIKTLANTVRSLRDEMKRKNDDGDDDL